MRVHGCCSVRACLYVMLGEASSPGSAMLLLHPQWVLLNKVCITAVD